MDRLLLQRLYLERIKELEMKEKTQIVSVFTRKTINDLNLSLKLLDDEITTGKISNKSKILRLIHDKNLKEDMINFFKEFEENYPVYTVDLCHKIRCDLDKYLKALKRFGTSEVRIPDALNEDFVNKYDAETFGMLLGTLIFKHRIDVNFAYRILFYSDSYRVNEVLCLFDKYEFNFVHFFGFNDFFFKLCDLRDDSYDNFVNNCQFLNLCGIHFKVDSYSSDILMRDNKIMSNISILCSYGLMGKIVDINNYYLFKILSSDNIASDIDAILEIGCYDFLKNNIETLALDRVKRLQVLKCIDTPVVDQEIYDITMKSERFVLSDEEIDLEFNTVIDDKNGYYLNLRLSDLEQFKLEDNNILYSIGGVLVSVNKVKRLLEEGNDMYTSITSGLVLSSLEFNNMMDVLKPFQYKKKQNN